MGADESGNPVPGLAESWVISDDGMSYTFNLRHDVEFHDGTPFNAAAVKFSLDRIIAPDTQSQLAITLIGPYASTDVVNEYTAKVNFSEPYAPFLGNLSLPYMAMVSPTAVEKWGADYQLHQVGTGPFIFKEYVPNERLVLERNPDYNWAPSFAQHTGPAYLDRVVFRFLPDSSARIRALEAGDVDVARELPPEQSPRLAQNPDFTLLVGAMPGQTMQFFMNTQREPTNDLKVRQALLYGTDPVSPPTRSSAATSQPPPVRWRRTRSDTIPRSRACTPTIRPRRPRFSKKQDGWTPMGTGFAKRTENRSH